MIVISLPTLSQIEKEMFEIKMLLLQSSVPQEQKKFSKMLKILHQMVLEGRYSNL